MTEPRRRMWIWLAVFLALFFVATGTAYGLTIKKITSRASIPELIADGLNRLSDFPFGTVDRQMWEACFGEFSLAAVNAIADATGLDAAIEAAGLEETLDDRSVEFPRVDERRVGRPARFGYAVHTRPGPDGFAGAVLAHEAADGRRRPAVEGDELLLAPQILLRRLRHALPPRSTHWSFGSMRRACKWPTRGPRHNRRR
mgnify:CR=1 FL=1